MSQSQLLHLALIQMDITIGEPDTNYGHLAQLLLQAVNGEQKPDVIIFPEMWNTGYALTEIHQLADVNGERTKAFLSAFAHEHQVNIIGGSIANKRGDRVLNTIYAWDREGREMAEYSKIHLFRLMDEEKFLHSGDQLGLFELEGVPAGAMICYDIRFPELSRKLALDGARILFVPAEWPHPRLHHWRTLLMARAIENQMYVVSCNRVGTSGTTNFFGHSMVIDPWGEVLVEGDESEAILRAEIDLEEVVRVRGKIPVFEDRRPHLY
ncbi:carbon-nitrogen family hydrolase [Paenibacillus roseipurpureus]|uniref:Carbon-nitrogen family hydrolase n=1 Tax=Paenibacillus roseopurpureus TaxID=2918901 RepID=A0AA96LK49_9BACL|nr:carbon-nitrogen family hydrolase [Paenibacillus sp. MBLB1832]WNR42389.1 carbon-nitrogen family hydrolase [Paenibacillus sp. MBLB1832]